MLKAYKYRLYPTKDQAKKIDHSIGVCRLVYNLALEVKTRAYKEHHSKQYLKTIQGGVRPAGPWSRLQ